MAPTNQPCLCRVGESVVRAALASDQAGGSHILAGGEDFTSHAAHEIPVDAGPDRAGPGVLRGGRTQPVPFSAEPTFSAANFVRHLEPARKKRGRAPLITDNAPRHKSKKVRRHPERNPDVIPLHLPAAGPGLSAVGVVRGQARYGPVTSEFHAMLDGTTAAVSEHPRTCAIRAGIYKYLMRSVLGGIFTACQYR